MQKKLFTPFKLAGVALTLAAVLAMSCGGGKPPSVPAEAPAAPTPAPTVQPAPKAEGTPAGQEALVTGNREWLLSSPEPDKSVNIQFVLDASGSMLQKAGDRSRFDIARDVVARVSGQLPGSVQLGLMAYGHRYPESNKDLSCSDIEQLTQLGASSADLTAHLGLVKPSGWTPIARSIQQAGNTMASQPQSINNIVLLSDGAETCEGNPIEVAQRLKESPAKVTVHTIGFAIDEDARKELGEIAAVSGGSYNEANDAQGLLSAVDRALLAARSGTFIRAELSGEGERRVSLPVQLSEPGTGKKIHELRSWIDSPIAPGAYDVLVGTAPRVVFRSVDIKPNTRTTIRFGVGGVRVELADAPGSPIKAMVHLKDKQTGALLRDFPTWYNQALLPGTYDLQIDSNPPVTRRGVTIGSKSLTIVDLKSGRLKVDAIKLGGERPNWEIQLRDGPGGTVVYRSLPGRELALWAGEYELQVLSHPEISMPVTVGPGEVRTVQLETGILRVELLDGQGRRLNLPLSLIDSAGHESKGFTSWEDASPLPGTYELVIPVQPPLSQAVQVSPTQPTILKVRVP